MKTSIFLPVLTLSLLVFSCSKQAPNVRSVKQTGAQVIDSNISGPSVNAAAQQGNYFKVISVERPVEASDGKITIKSEIQKHNSSEVIPVTTTHTNGSDAGGYISMNDGSDTTLDVRAGCVDTDCSKYIMLVTTVRNGASVHQTIVVSKTSDNFFYVKDINAAITSNFYRGTDAIAQLKILFKDL